MEVHAVTQTQWRAVMGIDPSEFKGPNLPVEQVSWDDCTEFCTRLTAHLDGRATVRLPTEAEWECACRAGTTTLYHFGDTISVDVANYNGYDAWYRSNSGDFRSELNRNHTTAVGSFPPNPWGLFDMHGNVSEWCADVAVPYTGDAQTDPCVTTEQHRAWILSSYSGIAHEQLRGRRVLRGGEWGTQPENCRSAMRDWERPDNRDDCSIGFRVAFCPTELHLT
jgi:formylglycine-generating enzyme required for sulfatase activity